MNAVLLLFDVPPAAGVIGGAAAIALFLVLLGVAFIAYTLLKRTAKMAFRMAVVGVILLIAVVGSASLWYFTSGGTKAPAQRPNANSRR